MIATGLTADSLSECTLVLCTPSVNGNSVRVLLGISFRRTAPGRDRCRATALVSALQNSLSRGKRKRIAPSQPFHCYFHFLKIKGRPHQIKPLGMPYPFLQVGRTCRRGFYPHGVHPLRDAGVTWSQTLPSRRNPRHPPNTSMCESLNYLGAIIVRS